MHKPGRYAEPGGFDIPPGEVQNLKNKKVKK